MSKSTHISRWKGEKHSSCIGPQLVLMMWTTSQKFMVQITRFLFLIFTVCGEKEGKIYLCVLLFCPESLSLDWNHNEFCEQHKQKAAGKYLFSATSYSCFLFLFQISSLLLNIDCKQDLSVGNPQLAFPQPSSPFHIYIFCPISAIFKSLHQRIHNSIMSRSPSSYGCSCPAGGIQIREEKVTLTLSYFLFLQIKYRKKG